MIKTCIPLRKEQVDEVVRVCEDIASKDASFTYKLYDKSYVRGYDYMLVIYSDSKDRAYQRGQWFVHRVGVDYFWVKYG